jgi:hypothetical protein
MGGQQSPPCQRAVVAGHWSQDESNQCDLKESFIFGGTTWLGGDQESLTKIMISSTCFARSMLVCAFMSFAVPAKRATTRRKRKSHYLK